MEEKYSWYLLSKYRRFYFGFAALVVTYHHLTIKSTDNIIGYFYVFTRVLGTMGVDIFLFCSGMGLFYSFFANKNLKFFYKKRFCRILPAYFIVCIPWYLYKCFIESNLGIRGFFQNILQISFWTEGNGEEWYIVFILMMYICFPLIYRVFFICKKNVLKINGGG